MPGQSQPYRGPYAVFSLKELERVRSIIRQVRNIAGKDEEVEAILAKLDRAIESSPKLRMPHP